MERRMVVMVVAAQAEGEVPPFDVWLQQVSGPLVSAVVGVVISWMVEFVPAYESLAPRYKRLVYFGLCMVVLVAAACLRAALGNDAGQADEGMHGLAVGRRAVFAAGDAAAAARLPVGAGAGDPG